MQSPHAREVAAVVVVLWDSMGAKLALSSNGDEPRFTAEIAAEKDATMVTLSIWFFVWFNY